MHLRESKPIIILAGPTASGKSALALEIAKTYNGIIINCDSKQVFKEIPIITAQPTKEEQERIEHKLYGCISVIEHCSVARWLTMAKEAIEYTHHHNKLPLLVGGTGFYIKAITEGLSPIPDIPEPIRNSVRSLFEQLGNETFFEKLCQKDPTINNLLHAGDSQRIQRAWEVLEATGKSITHWQQLPPLHDFADYAIQTFFLAPSREETYQRCNERFLHMVKQGVIDEIKPLEAMNLNIQLPAATAHGVPEIRNYLRKTMSLEEAIAQAQRNTRHYIKRQFTWFRGQMRNAIELTQSPYATMSRSIDEFLLTKSQ